MPQYDLNLRDYLRIFRRRKPTIIITFLVVLIVSVVYVSTQPVLYRVSATVKIEERKTIAGLLTEWIVYNPADVMESETKAIKGYPVMKKVAFGMKMITDKSSIDDINEAISSIQTKIQTERIKSTNMIEISSVSTDPRQAVELVNMVANTYIEENLLEKAKQARHTRQFIEEQLSSLENRLKATEDEMKNYGDEVKNVRLAEPIEKKLVELQFQLAELLQKYTEKHPRVIQTKEQIEMMEQQAKGVSSQGLEYARLIREVEVNKKLYGMLKEKLEEARITEAQKVGDVSVVDPAVIPAGPISGNKGLGMVLGAMMGLILSFTLAFVLETLDTSIGTIEDVENVLKLPVLGLISSIEEEFNKDSNFVDKIKYSITRPPKTDEEEKLVRLIAHFKPRSPAAEAYRNIHTNLKLDVGKRLIMVTSSGPKEGKSTVVSNLGIVMCQSGLRTVLVSADLRRPVMNKVFGINREPGLSEVLTGTVRPEKAIYNMTDMLLGGLKLEELRLTPGIENISIIPSGHLPHNPVELLESSNMDNLLKYLRDKFDAVIIDSPPVLPVTDASLLAPRMDSTIIVYEIGRTSREALIRCKVQLESVGARISGVVLNNTRMNAEAFVPDPYYYHYKYRYYGKSEQDTPGEKNSSQERPKKS